MNKCFKTYNRITEKLITGQSTSSPNILGYHNLQSLLGIRKQMLPTIPSLVKICDAFGITVSQFFLEKNEQTVHLTEKQASLLAASAKLSSEQYDALLSFIELL